ncbi:hypothetical protein ACSBR2_016072 [Camellia fascicularis]
MDVLLTGATMMVAIVSGLPAGCYDIRRQRSNGTRKGRCIGCAHSLTDQCRYWLAFGVREFRLRVEFNVVGVVFDDFSISNKIGEGGFGPVYKGTLEEGQQIAVKRLSKSSRQGLDEFKNEVLCIAKLQYRNLVKLLGCCIEEEEHVDL